MFVAIFFFVAFTVVLIANILLKRRVFTPSSWMLFIYWFSAVNTIPCVLTGGIEITDFYLVNDTKYFLPALYLLFMLMAFFFPFLHFNECKIEKFELPNEKILGLFSTFIIVLSIFSTIYFIPTITNIFSMGDLGAARNERYQFDMEYTDGGMMNTIASVGSSFYEFAISLFFIYLAKGGHPKRVILLFISSLSNIIHVLAYVGRDGVIFWLFSFVFEFFLFYPFLKKKIRHTISYSFTALGTLIMIPFIMISSGRFGEFVLLALTDYMGQPLLNGTLYFGIDAAQRPHNYGDRFPLFWQIIGQAEPERIPWETGGTASWVFGTFVTNFEENIGTIGSILACIILGVCFLHTFHRKQETFPFYKIFLYILYFQIFSQGVFYFRQYTRGGNLYVVISIVFAMIFKVLEKEFEPDYLLLSKEGPNKKEKQEKDKEKVEEILIEKKQEDNEHID